MADVIQIGEMCLHTGTGNTGTNYDMARTILSKTMKEKYLGVTMNANMKVSEQFRIAASKGNQVLGMIRRNITFKENSLIVPLYKGVVRPHLEYCILDGYPASANAPPPRIRFLRIVKNPRSTRAPKTT